MKIFVGLLLVVVSLPMFSPAQTPAQVSRRKTFIDQHNARTKITNGPIVESLKCDSATIAWSTNVKSGSEVKYGPSKIRLNQSQDAPPDGKGLMHRIQLKNLRPNTTYYFLVQSQGAENNTADRTKMMSFTTPVLGAEARHNQLPQ